MKSDYYHCPMCGVNVIYGEYPGWPKPCAACMMEDSLNQSPKPVPLRKPDKEECDRIEKLLRDKSS